MFASVAPSLEEPLSAKVVDEKAVSDGKGGESEDLPRQDDLVPSRIGAIVAMRLNVHRAVSVRDVVLVRSCL